MTSPFNICWQNFCLFISRPTSTPTGSSFPSSRLSWSQASFWLRTRLTRRRWRNNAPQYSSPIKRSWRSRRWTRRSRRTWRCKRDQNVMSWRQRRNWLVSPIMRPSRQRSTCGSKTLGPQRCCLSVNYLICCISSESVTRFGKISPLWLNFKSLGQIFDGLFLNSQTVEPTLANFLHYRVNFHCSNWPNIQT